LRKGRPASTTAIRSWALGIRAEPLSEARVRSMDVENPKLAVTRVPKAMQHSNRYGNPRSGTSADYLIAKGELSFSFQDIKGIHVVPVNMRVDAESRAEASVDYLELG
jgi:hypothetical protein